MTRREIFAALGATLFVALLGCVLVGAVFCQGTLHVPRRIGPTPPNAKTVTVLAADKVTLSAWWLQAAKPNGNCVIVLHGIGDSRVGSVGFAPMFLAEGYNVLLPIAVRTAQAAAVSLPMDCWKDTTCSAGRSGPSGLGAENSTGWESLLAAPY